MCKRQSTIGRLKVARSGGEYLPCVWTDADGRVVGRFLHRYDMDAVGLHVKLREATEKLLNWVRHTHKQDAVNNPPCAAMARILGQIDRGREGRRSFRHEMSASRK